MKVDVSEIKTFKTCKRQWELSSRNKFHLRPRVLSPNLTLGTLFHEALAQLYLGVSLETVMKQVREKMNPDTDTALLAMIPGYAERILPTDLKHFRVLDIEHHFEIEPKTQDGVPIFQREWTRDADHNITSWPSLTICGAIDMIVIDDEDNKIYGFEHKTCKNFRDGTFLWMDEQPRVYTWALQQYVDEYNEKLESKWKAECHKQGWDVSCATEPPIPEPVPVKLGGVFLNEVRKLLRQFQHQRTLCVYTQADLDHFMQSFFADCGTCKNVVEDGVYAAPKPSYMTCKLCQFQDICRMYMYAPLNETEILNKFSDDFVKRSEDHLEEKTERSVENDA